MNLRRLNRTAPLLMIAAGILAGAAFAGLTPAPQRAPGLEWLASPRPVAGFELAGESTPFTRTDLAGAWHMLVFGYGNCPDICPTTLVNLKALRNAVANPQLTVVFVSVDPRRDTPARLTAYARHFHPDFLGVSGDEANLRALANSVGVRFKLPTGGSTETVTHSVTMSLIDPNGKLVARLRPGFDLHATAREIVAAIRARA